MRVRVPLLISLAILPSFASAPAVGQDRNDIEKILWVTAGAALGGSFFFDEQIRDQVPPGGGTTWEPLTDQLNFLGHPAYVVPAIAGTYIAGRLTHHRGLSTSAAHILAGLLANGIANGTVKTVVGRERPAGGDAFSFRPFSLENYWHAFPSGHTTVAFSVATALSTEADHPLVTGAVFTAATLVGWSRIYEDKHWTSDVIGGAIIGVAATRSAMKVIHRISPHADAGNAPQIALLPRGIVVTVPTP